MTTLHINLSILLLLFVCCAQGEVPDTRGPVQNAGMRVVANAEGVQAPGYTWQEPEALSSWTAKWIGPPAAPKSVASCLRKVVKLKAAPSKVTAWITGSGYWKSGRWSTQICMITHHLDSPEHQEPISDYGDYLIEDLVNFSTMGTNPWLARQDLRKWAWVMENTHYHTFHTSYVFYWLQSLLNYYDYTGDRTVIDEVAPQVQSLLDQYTTYLGKNGIISEAPNYMFMDWVTVHDDKDPKIAFACHHPPAVRAISRWEALRHVREAGQVVAGRCADGEFQRAEQHLRRALRPRTPGTAAGNPARHAEKSELGCDALLHAFRL
jgi:hypothetical protein